MCDIDGKCKCKNTNGKMGSAASLTSIAFQTGVMLERGRIIKLIQDYFKKTGESIQGDLVEIINKGKKDD